MPIIPGHPLNQRFLSPVNSWFQQRPLCISRQMCFSLVYGPGPCSMSILVPGNLSQANYKVRAPASLSSLQPFPATIHVRINRMCTLSRTTLSFLLMSHSVYHTAVIPTEFFLSNIFSSSRREKPSILQNRCSKTGTTVNICQNISSFTEN